jgi:predicted transcriptional regulator
MRRSRQRIIYEILQICRNGVNKTTIVYQANINFRSVKSYLQVLIENHLIDANQGEYQTTLKGISLLETLNQVEEQLYEHDKIEPVICQGMIMDRTPAKVKKKNEKQEGRRQKVQASGRS